MKHNARRLTYFFVLAICFAQAASATGHEGKFVSLFDGKSFDGWKQHGGKATYTIEKGTIVGTSIANTPNSFMSTTRDYGDFVLELEVKVDNELNSGIQFRSHVFDHPIEVTFIDSEGKPGSKKLPTDRVHGYQAEIDPSPRSFSGGIYDEARRGWLYKPSGDENKKGREAFKRGEWNKYRIEAIGNSLKTWINGVPVAEVTDDMDASGLIALQVHAVHNENKVGKKVRWRNIRIREVK